MSRNRASCDCACGFWSFHTLPDGRVIVDDPSLRTWEQYKLDTDKRADYPYTPYLLESAYSHHGPYRRELENPHYRWLTRDGNGSSNYPHDGYNIKQLLCEYAPVLPSERYRFRQIACPICRRLYLGWYVQQPYAIAGSAFEAGVMDPRGYEIFDTSFYWSYNDEPSDRDVRDVIDWSGNLLASAAREYVERHPELFRRKP